MKLPVFKALATTFAFSLENWARLLKIVWLPFLLMFGVSYWFQLHVSGRTAELLAQGSALEYETVQAFNMEVFWLNACASIGLGLLGLMVSAGILRLVIRGESPSLPFNLRWGGDEWALLVTSIALFGAMFLIIFVGSIVIGILAAATGVPLLAFIALAVLMLWLGVRFYLAFPAAVAQQQLGLVPAWEASGSQFWRLLGYLVLLGLLGIAFQIAVMAVVTPQQLGFLIELYTGRLDAISVNMRIAELTQPGTIEGVLRTGAMWVLSLVPTVIGTVALGVAWRMIDEDNGRPKPSAEDSASSVMGF